MLEKKCLNPLTTLTMFIHVIFHLLCSLPGYLGVMIQSYEHVSFTLYMWERYLILIQFFSTYSTAVPKY